MAQRVALQSASYLQQRCMVVTQTNEQAYDLTRRLADNARGMPVYMFATRSLALPDDLRRSARVEAVQGSATCRKPLHHHRQRREVVVDPDTPIRCSTCRSLTRPSNCPTTGTT